MFTTYSADVLQKRRQQPLHQAAADFMEMIEARELAEETLSLYRTTLWDIFKFLACDPPVRELAEDTPAKFMDWMRKTPIAPRMSKTLAKKFTAASVSAFLAWPPRTRITESNRCEQTIGRYLAHSAPFFEFLGMPVRLPKQGPGHRPNMNLPPALVPMRTQIESWWRDTWTATDMPAKTKRRLPPTRAQRRHVLYVQGLVYLTGLRIEEALTGLLSDVEGHWLLIRQTKTHKPRIIYLNSESLGIMAALHADRQATFFDIGDEGARKYLCCWDQELSTWHTLVRDCQSPQHHQAAEKRHQKMRQKLSTWMRRRDPDSEAAQLGHGSGVVFTNYLDYLRPLPKLLEKYRLPELGLEGFSWPAPVEVKMRRPDRLYAEIRRLVNSGA
jgi:integrase